MMTKEGSTKIVNFMTKHHLLKTEKNWGNLYFGQFKLVYLIKYDCNHIVWSFPKQTCECSCCLWRVLFLSLLLLFYNTIKLLTFGLFCFTVTVWKENLTALSRSNKYISFQRIINLIKMSVKYQTSLNSKTIRILFENHQVEKKKPHSF